MSSKPAGYSRLQIALHWVIFLLIAVQFLFHDGMEEAWEAVTRGTYAGPSAGAMLHVVVGLSVLVLVVLRLGVKLKRGSPALPEEEPAVLRAVAHGTHWALYALMILVPLSGAVAWFTVNENAGDGHEVMKSVLFILVALHFAGALFQRFVLKSDVMTRMVRPGA
ncbi:cytochrome b [Maritimibacter sp. DP1N21-5]|uniref:cytochrome b n=1 Tax=Maritimibacter sp. DP1N21-5 TaxID=2836867 RepID=UPI001C447724|nr:cytochrome b/b6 domain-containing protein [Maritimibacter sp. DP1N21-5]MBV7408028.1 cytochrome b/b6 domain-containing protein [Maritimibacter sp. DP1N21-5]